MSVFYSTVCEVLGGRAKTADDPRGNTAPTVLTQMHYRYRGTTVHSVPSPRYYREILPIPTVITAVTAVLPHSPLPCHSLTDSDNACLQTAVITEAPAKPLTYISPHGMHTLVRNPSALSAFISPLFHVPLHDELVCNITQQTYTPCLKKNCAKLFLP